MSVRDESVDIAKGLGILFVIGGHCGFNLPGFHSQSFHMPLFYFISGFFISKYILNKDESALKFIHKKFHSLLLPYFIYNVFFGILSYFLQFIGIEFNKGTIFEILSIKNIFIEPFLRGWQYPISGPLWFVPSLFCVMVMIMFLRPILTYVYKQKRWQLILMVSLIVVFYLCIYTPHAQNNIYIGALTRNIIGLVYCILGFFYYQYKKYIDSKFIIFISIIIYSYMETKYGEFYYDLHLSVYGNGMEKNFSLLIQLSGLLIIVAFSNIIANKSGTIKEFLIYFGKNSYHVMAWHLSGVLILNIILIMFYNFSLNFSVIKDSTWKLPNIMWLYFIFSTFFSYLILKHVPFIHRLFRLNGLKS